MVERRTVTGIALRWSHLILLLLSWLVLAVLGYASLRYDTTQNAKDIQDLRSHQVDKDQMQEFREDVQRRLQRIEDKLDREKAIRELH